MGGAAGHMNHPFDVDWVNSGEDLTDFFLDAAEYLQTNPASIKWDGVNTSFKLITDENGRKDFRVDRGNQEPMPNKPTQNGKRDMACQLQLKSCWRYLMKLSQT